MDIFLRFKNKKHADAFNLDLEQQAHVRLVMIGLAGAVGVVISTFMASSTPQVVNKASHILRTIRFILMLTNFVGNYLLKKYMHRLKPQAPKLLVILDLISCTSQFVIYPIAGNVSVDDFSKLGVYVWAWYAGFCAFSIYFTLWSWWIKVLNVISQMAYFFYFVIKREPIFTPILSLGLIGASTFVILSYVQELYLKKDFLEKIKIYENYEALKRIFDDISQGIIIVDTKLSTIYANRTVDIMFHRQPSQEVIAITSLFARIQVKSMIPFLASVITERIMVSQENIQVK